MRTPSEPAPTGGVFRAADDALARAVAYSALSAGFETTHGARQEEMFTLEGIRILERAVQRIGRSGGRVPLERAVARLAALAATTHSARAASLVRLFGHTARGLVCACETEYGPDNAFHQPQQLANIAGYYLAFGIGPAAAGATRVDHVACELEFMGFLNRKEAMLLAARGRSWVDEETLHVTARAARTFLRDHLARFGRAFAIRVMAEDAGGWFGALGQTLLALIDAECARLHVEAGPPDLALRPEVPDAAPIACGPADDLIQIQRHPTCG